MNLLSFPDITAASTSYGSLWESHSGGQAILHDRYPLFDLKIFRPSYRSSLTRVSDTLRYERTGRFPGKDNNNGHWLSVAFLDATSECYVRCEVVVAIRDTYSQTN